MTIPVRAALPLAVAATGTAVAMSVLAGWQRGGWLAEKLVWVSVGVVLVVGAHLLPALCRTAPVRVKITGAVLWLATMAAASYGHATFFLVSQAHAGSVRADVVRDIDIPPHRTLTNVMQDRAAATGTLAVIEARHCVGNCATLQVHHDSLLAQIEALNAEADDIKRWERLADSNAVRRDASRDDPVTSRLAAFFGNSVEHLDLLTGLGIAAVLEGMGCLSWWFALTPAPVAPATPQSREIGREVVPVVTAVAERADASRPARPPTTHDRAMLTLMDDIAAGRLRPTVSEIRRHLGCSQAKAISLRRQLAALSA